MSMLVVKAMAVETQSTRKSSKHRLSQQAEEFFVRYGKPLEAEHSGDFIAISTQGKVVRAPTLQQVLDLSLEQLGKGSYVFRVGADRSVIKWR